MCFRRYDVTHGRCALIADSIISIARRSINHRPTLDASQTQEQAAAGLYATAQRRQTNASFVDR